MKHETTEPQNFTGFKWWAYNSAVSVDQSINCILFLGFPDETVSGRLGRAIKEKNPKWFVKPLHAFVDWLFLKLFGQRDHCEWSLEPEEKFEDRTEIWSWSRR